MLESQRQGPSPTWTPQAELPLFATPAPSSAGTATGRTQARTNSRHAMPCSCFMICTRRHWNRCRGRLRWLASPALLVATRKGAFILKGDQSRRSWKVSAPIQLGHIIHHIVQDPRAPRETADVHQHRAPGPDHAALEGQGPDAGRKSRSRRHFRRRPRARRPMCWATASGSHRATPANRASGTWAHRRRDCSAARTAATAGSPCVA